FTNSNAVKDFALDESAPAIVRAIGDRVAANAPAADLDARFLQEFGTPAAADARILPLILKDKVAALLYADSGTGAGGLLEAGALELLVLSTSAWLEVNSLRKHAHKETSGAHVDSHPVDSHEAAGNGVPAAEFPSYPAAHTGSSHTGPAYNDPFSSHTPSYAMAATASAGEASASVASSAVEVPAAMIAEDATTEVQSSVAVMDRALADPLPISHAETKAAPEM